MSNRYFLIAAAALTCSAMVSCGTPGASGALSQALLAGQQQSVSSATTASSQSSSTNVSSLISNLIASVTGNATTTKNTILGTWTYSEPCVQFESNNLLTQAGGSTMATKSEQKLASYYQMVGIKPGKMVFTFASDGSVTYKVGNTQRKGTYTFDSNNKTITITSQMGQSVKAYVTVSGINMALTFDATKLLSLMGSVGSNFQQLQLVSALASNYDGMKVGFKFSK